MASTMTDVSPRQGQVWWTALDPVAGSEIRQTRPALVLSRNEINRLPRHLSIVVPITSTQRAGSVPVTLPDADGAPRIGYAEPWQTRAISHSRLRSLIGEAPVDVCRDVANRLRVLTEPPE
jgi:mRNA interferase MazF